MTEPTVAPYGAWESPFPISLLTSRRRRAERDQGPRRRPLVARGPARREGPPGPRPARRRRHRHPPLAGGLQRPLAGPRIRRRGVPRRGRPRHRVGLLDRPPEPRRRPRRARAAHARADVALRRLDPGPGPRPAHRDSRGPRAGDARAPRRGRERDRRHRPRERRGLGPRRRGRLLRGAAPVAGWLAARLARVAPPEHAVGRHDAAPRAGRRRRLDRRGGDRRRQPVGLDLAAALVARRRPPLRGGARRLDEPVPVRRRPGRGGHGPRGGVRLPRLAVRLLDLRVRGRRVDRGRCPVGRSGSAVPRRAGARRHPRDRGAVHRDELDRRGWRSRRAPGRGTRQGGGDRRARPGDRELDRAPAGDADAARPRRTSRSPGPSSSRRPAARARTASSTRRRTARSAARPGTCRRSSSRATAARPQPPTRA